MAASDALELFHPIIREWFQNTIGQPSPPQVEGWPAVQRGENVLISAPTGAGKTLSAFLGCIDYLFKEGIQGKLADEVYVLYISPLKALNNDIYRNLELPLEGIRALCQEKGIDFPPITKAVRTGDTPPSERRSMLKKPPHILITTPESLYLLLTSQKACTILKKVRYCIIDEIHSLLGSKRGVHLALSLERLAFLTEKSFVRIGLSATVRPIEEAAKYLGGFYRKDGAWVPRPVTIVQPAMEKHFDLRIAIPVNDYRVLDEGSIWPYIFSEVLSLVENHKSTLVFVNNRAVAEKVAANLNQLAGKVIARTHHGCISRESRLEVEQQLKRGDLPCLVCTSSLELGIDVGAIDLVIQVASPKSAARGLQRLGRAGHRLNQTSKGRIIPRTRGDLLETVIVAREMLNGNIEEEKVPMNCLDILAQQLVAMACVREWTFEEIKQVIKGTYSYQELNEDELERVLSMLAGDYEHWEDMPRSPRIVWDRINRTMSGTGYSRMLAIGGGGTIPDRGYYAVYLEDGNTRLGELDEVFVFEARLGDRFMLGSSAWRIKKIERDRVIVTPSSPVGAKTPFWTGDGLGRPYELALKFAAFLRELGERAGTSSYMNWIMESAPVDEAAARNLENYIQEQKAALGCLPHDRQIVVEYFSDEVGERRIVIHSPFGGRVNAGMAILMEHALSQALRCQVEASHTDDGVLIHMLGYPVHPAHILSLLSSDKVEEALIERLPTTPLFAMVFRYNATRALMMGVQSHGRRTPLWIQRMRGLEALQVAEKFIDHPLIVETFRECMETVLDVPSLVKVLQGIEKGDIAVVEKVTSHPSPFTSELLFGFMSVMMYEGQIPKPMHPNSTIISHKDALHLNYKHAAYAPYGTHKLSAEQMEWRQKAIEQVIHQNRPLHREKGLRTADELHGLLLTYGDMKINEQTLYELAELCPEPPASWLEQLKEKGRLVRLHSRDGQDDLWIAAEEYSLYETAMATSSDNNTAKEEAAARIIRRYARFYSPFTDEEIADRYPFSLSLIRKVLAELEEDGLLVKGSYTRNDTAEWCHILVEDRIQRLTLQLARKAVKAREKWALAAFLPAWQGVGRETVAPVEGLYDVVKQFRGLYLPVTWWEDFIFPARIKGYRKGYLDQLCSSGRIVWRIQSKGSTPKLAWYTADDLAMPDEESACTMDGASQAVYDELNDHEKKVLSALERRGACFLHLLAAMTRLTNEELLEALESLVWKGMVVNDSFECIRYFSIENTGNVKSRARRRAMAYKMDMGRWEIASPVQSFSLEDQLAIWLERYGLIAKEMIQWEDSGWSWLEVYELLKQWELIGKVNRGYYFKGLSGIQYMLPKAQSLLDSTTAGLHVLNACDPAQVYGRILPPDGSGTWICVPGTAVVLDKGVPVLVAERYGERFWSPCAEDKKAEKGLKAFVEAYHAGQIWGSSKRIKMKIWNDLSPSQSPSVSVMKDCGFEPEMQDMTLWKKI